MATASHSVRQAAVIAVKSGRVCLVMSSSGRRWVVPKGHIEPGQTAGEAALQEAWEEAGLTGILQDEPLGSYVYQKCGQRYHVTVFVMGVTGVADKWPERSRRGRHWLRPERAVACVEEPGLRKLLRRLLPADVVEVPA
ncbi:MAG TPA: NUDIX hydrolase [Gemmataceae bacterium]|nr:NUDIX hydrolase [Gemmataceae bacterium]